MVDLTHALGPDFPTYDGGSDLGMETLVTLAKDGYNMKRWRLVEHTGTHMDAPIHFGDGVRSADQIPVEDLVVPLAVVDIRAKAQDDADAELTPDDLQAFEAEHGPIPAGACVAMLSGWDARASGAEFRNADNEGVMHFPGFHVEAAQYLMGERNAVGIAVDTLSLDYGKSADFATHYAWLPTNAPAMPDLTPAILAAIGDDAAAPASDTRLTLRWILAVLALVQIGVAVPALLLGSDADLPVHAARHLGSFDIAVAVGFLFAAWRPARIPGLLPVVAALVACLVASSLLDVAAGNTGALGEAHHATEFAGLAVLWLLGRGVAHREAMPRPELA